jgi:replicative DNA helicase
MYDESSPRYLTVTGHKRGSQTLLLHSQCALEVIHARYLGAEEIEGTKLAPACAPPPDDLDTERILEKATTAANGEKFSKLWRGEWQGDYPSQSEADLALAGSLAFWCGRDPEAIDTMFRRSGLYRDKWERADYREGTIAKAMERDRFYDWGADGEAVEAVVTGGSLPLPSGNGQATGDKPDIVKEIEEAKAKKPPPSFTRMMSSAELEELDQKNAFLIEDVLVKGQPLVFGGPGKAMKTSVSVDFAVSLGSATPFLGKFAVPRKVRVAFWTGESGEMTIKETAIRIAKSKGRRLRDCSVDWSFDLPKLCRPDHLTALREHIASRQYEVVIVDPLYLSLLSAENAGLAGNVYAMGAALSPVGEMGKYSGCTVCLIHHFKKIGTGDVNNPCALEDLSQSGISEWARQWILLQRRTPYTSDGTHELWMRLGGSAGHASLNALTIDEGLLDSKTMSGRHWRVQVRSQSQAISEEKTRKAEEKATAAEKENAVLSAKVVEYLKTRPDGETARVMRTALGLGEAKMRGVLGALLLSATIAECQIRKTNASFPGYKLA